MVEVLTGEDILAACKSVLAADGEVVLAVSYWGDGATKALCESACCENVWIVLNVEHGGTNPTELRRLMELFPDRVRVSATLHAKIYASPTLAVVGSANASSNGLNFGRNGHTEAAVKLEGADAEKALKLAAEFYGQAKRATVEHLAICKARFGQRSVANTLGEESDERAGSITDPALKTFLRRQDVLGHLPALLTAGDCDPKIRDRDWELHSRNSEEVAAEEQFDGKKWDYVHAHLDQRYWDKLTVNIHQWTGNGQWERNRLSLHLVRPMEIGGGEGTFLKRLPWSEFPDLGAHWDGLARYLKPSEVLVAAHDELCDEDEAYLTVWDVYERFEAALADPSETADERRDVIA